MAQTFWSGNGGYIVIQGVTLHIGKWTLRKTARLTENTHSGVPATNFEKVVPHYEWTAEIPWDSKNIPDTDVGLVEGTKLTSITFRYGISGKFSSLANTSVETLEEVNDNATDIARTVCSGKGGNLTARALTG